MARSRRAPVAHVCACVAAEPTSLLELQPSVEWDRAQHSLMESDEPFYIQRATGVRGDVKVADDLYCGALTNPDGDIFCSGDLCAARIHPLHSPGRLEARTHFSPTLAAAGATMATLSPAGWRPAFARRTASTSTLWSRGQTR
jgi:hypothetical protein